MGDCDNCGGLGGVVDKYAFFTRMQSFKKRDMIFRATGESLGGGASVRPERRVAGRLGIERAKQVTDNLLLTFDSLPEEVNVLQLVVKKIARALMIDDILGLNLDLGIRLNAELEDLSDVREVRQFVIDAFDLVMNEDGHVIGEGIKARIIMNLPMLLAETGKVSVYEGGNRSSVLEDNKYEIGKIYDMPGWIAGGNTNSEFPERKPDFLALCKGFMKHGSGELAVFEFDPKTIDKESEYYLGQKITFGLTAGARVTSINDVGMKIIRRGRVIGFTQYAEPIVCYEEMGWEKYCLIKGTANNKRIHLIDSYEGIE